MKYSVNILFLLTILAAIEAALASHGVDWPVLIVVALGAILLWEQLQRRGAEVATAQVDMQHTKGNELSVAGEPQRNLTALFVLRITAGCMGAAVFSILASPRDPETGKSLLENPRLASATSVLILATIVLSLMVSQSRVSSFKLFRTALAVPLIVAMTLGLVFSADIGLWLVYIACRGIELATLDPGRILGVPKTLFYSVAVLKALVGVMGWGLWILVAMLAYRRVQKGSRGVFVDVWLAGGVACLATLLQWQFLFHDFPELQMGMHALLTPISSLGSLNVVLLLTVSAVGFVQYCTLDRRSQRPTDESAGAWRTWLAGVVMILPVLVGVVVPVSRIDWASTGGLELIFLASELLSHESLMLFSLLIVGSRVMAKSTSGPVNLLPCATGALVQLLMIGFLLSVLVPIHFTAAQFYFDAILMMSPRF